MKKTVSSALLCFAVALAALSVFESTADASRLGTGLKNNFGNCTVECGQDYPPCLCSQ